MVHCERCGSSYKGNRMRQAQLCPRCLLRSDVAVPLVPGPPRRDSASPPSTPRGSSTLAVHATPDNGSTESG